MAPPKPSVMATGKHLLNAASMLSANTRCSETSPGNFANVILGFPSNEPSRRKLNTIVSSDPTLPFGACRQRFNVPKSSRKLFAGASDARGSDGASISASAATRTPGRVCQLRLNDDTFLTRALSFS
jgi:hypothetical protein